MKKSYIIIILLVIMNVISIGYIIYDKVLISDDINNNENNTNKNLNNVYQDYEKKGSDEYGNYTIKYSFGKIENYNSVVEANDTYAFAMDEIFGTRLYILHDGTLYYYEKSCYNEPNKCIGYILYSFKNNYNNELIPYTKLTNIKRIKSVNLGSGVDFSLLLITENGEVYTLSSAEGELQQVEALSKYKVDDITEFYAGVPDKHYKAILQDGQTLDYSYTWTDTYN